MKKLHIIICLITLFILFSSFTQNKSVNTAADNSIKLQLTSSHFSFYSSSKDKSCLKDFSHALDTNYSRITRDLKVTIKNKIPVYMYPDLISFHKAIGHPEAPSWVVGTALENNCIKMVSPNAPNLENSYEDIQKTIIHEFTHIVIHQVTPNSDMLPRWLNEGTAAYESGQAENISDNT